MEGTGITVKTGDSIETGQNGGQTISCTKGSYWIDQAISACSNNSSSVSFSMLMLMEQRSQIVLLSLEVSNQVTLSLILRVDVTPMVLMVVMEVEVPRVVMVDRLDMVVVEDQVIPLEFKLIRPHLVGELVFLRLSSLLLVVFILMMREEFLSSLPQIIDSQSLALLRQLVKFFLVQIPVLMTLDGWHISSRLVTGESMEDIMDFQTQ